MQKTGTPGRTRTCSLRISTSATAFAAASAVASGVWEPDHLFAVSGAVRMASTEPLAGIRQEEKKQLLPILKNEPSKGFLGITISRTC